MVQRVFKLVVVVGLLAIGGLSGCSSTPIDERDPAEVLKLAEGDISDSRFSLAIEKLRIVRNKHPYSAEARLAQLRLADVYFLQESFLEAALTYEAFRDLYPKHPRVGYATFRIAKSYFMDIPETIARDMASAFKAERAYGDYLSRFPNTELTEEARRDLADTRNRIAAKEMIIASWYKKQDAYVSSEARLRGISKSYGDTLVAKDAEALLTQVAEPAKEQREQQEKQRQEEEQKRLQRIADES